MDASLFKDFKTSRGFNYHYFYSPAKGPRPTLFFLHGNPSVATDWAQIVPHFTSRGYGVLAPDMLGYGDTDKPTDPALYVSSGMCRNLVDLLDHEGLEKVIAIGHDWGCLSVSRLASYYPERVIAYAFLAASFIGPIPPIPFDAFLEYIKQQVGYELYGYWKFYSEPGLDQFVRDHLDTFLSILWPSDPAVWKTRLAPTGALKQSALEGWTAPLAPYITEEFKKHHVEVFTKNGFEAPACYYRIMTSGLQAEDDKQILPERAVPPKDAPVFFGAANKDYICIPALAYATFKKDEWKDHKITIKEYDADHWLILSHADQVSRDLEAWIEGFASGGQ